MKITKEQAKEIANNGILFLSNKDIVSIEEFPKGLRKIFIDNNNLCNLPELHEGLEELYCYNNNLMELPELPKSLVKLDCSNNCIEDLSFGVHDFTTDDENVVTGGIDSIIKDIDDSLGFTSLEEDFDTDSLDI